jgi:iron complex transport system ATP-binding protein
MLHFDQLTIGYGHKAFIRNFTAHFLPGQFIGILGANGSGKTTLLRTLSKLVAPKEGRIIIGNTNLHSFSEKELARIRCYIPAEITCTWSLAARHVLEIGGSFDLKDWPHKLNLETLLDQPFNSLSSGEKARVMLAHSFIRCPKILLADEITSHLDSDYQDRVMELLRAYARGGKIVIIVLHQEDLAYAFCDQVFVIQDQKLQLTSKKPPQLREQHLS